VALSLVVAGGLVGLLLWQVELSEVWAVLAGGRLDLLVPASALLALHYVLKGLRWRALLGPEVPRLLAVKLTMVGFLLNNLFPARAGELGRPYLLSKNHPDASFAFALATLIGDKLLDLLFTLLCLGLAASVLSMPDFVRAGAAALATIGLVAMGTAVGAGRWLERGGRLPARWEERFVRPLVVARDFAAGLGTVSRPRRFLAASAWTAGTFVLASFALVLCMQAVGVEGDVGHALFVLGLLGIGFAIPSPPTHAGTYHFFAAQALQLSGVAEPETAVAFALLAHALQVVTVSVLGLASTVGLDWRGPLGRLRAPGVGSPDEVSEP